MTRRLPKLENESLSARQREVMEQIRAFSEHATRGPFDMMLRSPEACARFQSMGEYLRFETGIDDTLIELAILVHARVWNDQYEWKLHAPRARAAGLAETIIESLRIGNLPGGLGDSQRAVFSYVIELEVAHRIRNETFAMAVEALGEKAITDLVFILGQYATISMMLAVCGDDDDRGDSLPACARPFDDYFRRS